jgi:hypothetical protein
MSLVLPASFEHHGMWRMRLERGRLPQRLAAGGVERQRQRYKQITLCGAIATSTRVREGQAGAAGSSGGPRHAGALSRRGTPG